MLNFFLKEENSESEKTGKAKKAPKIFGEFKRVEYYRQPIIVENATITGEGKY